MKLFSIGETSKLNNIPVKTLRYYDEIGLLKPVYINEDTGYRYYSYSQFVRIDKIKRFKKLNISLKAMEEALNSGQDPQAAKAFFKNEKEKIDEELHRLEIMKTSLAKLEEYYEYCKLIHLNQGIYIRQMDERFYLSYDCKSNETIDAMDLGLRKIANKYSDTINGFYNPYGYVLNAEAFQNNQILIEKSTVGVVFDGEDPYKHIYTAPKGNYLCFSTKLLSNPPNISPLVEFLQKNDIEVKTILTEEFTYLTDKPYDEADYEIQVLLNGHIEI